MVDFIPNANVNTLLIVVSFISVGIALLRKCYLNTLQDRREHNISNTFLVVPYKNISKVEFKDD